MKVTFVCTVLNEERTIRTFLDSLIRQSRMPDEIILVDGGSVDKTTMIVEEYRYRYPIIKVIVAAGSNIARGRNIGIAAAKGEIILVSDAGCKLREDWVKKMVAPFEKDPDLEVVKGFYEPISLSFYQECVGDIMIAHREDVDPERFLASSRSLAFKKYVWGKSGGYPEWLYSSEDTLFSIKMQKMSFNSVFVSDAIVDWYPRQNSRQVFRIFRTMGQGQARTWRNMYNYTDVILRYSALVVLVLLGTFHSPVFFFFPMPLAVIFVTILFRRPLRRKKRGLLRYVTCYSYIIIFCDLGFLLGYTMGLLERYLIKSYRERLESYLER